ncbi:MAG: hypothetical protein M0024_14080 [Nitrospiraceae bacterium]|nr:hypothetical protein [Nitrospiraceae bacterium]
MNAARGKDNAQMLSKVPEVTIIFWAIKVMGTTIGETAADFLSANLGLGLTGTSFIMGGLLAVSLFIQLRSRKYVPWIYWTTVVLISIVGTLITDNLVDNFGVPLQLTTTIFGFATASIFALWYRSEKTLSIHSIYTLKRELYYWVAILFTFALGTAAGDLSAEGLRLGYAVSALVFSVLIGAVTVAHYRFRVNAIATFWLAYILTRPLGASCGDLLTQSAANGGLGLGAATISILYLLTITGLVVYLTLIQNKIQREGNAGAIAGEGDRTD